MTTGDAALCWRVERACAAAWPARDRRMIGAWVVHRSGGGSRRTNSASPAAAAAPLDAGTLDAIRAAYAAAGQPAILRLTHLWRGDADALDRAGFLPAEVPSRTLLRRPQRSEGIRSAVLLSATPEHEWLATRRRLSPSDAADHHLVPTRVTAPAAFARRVEGGCDVAIGYAALTGGVAVLEAIGTDPRARGRGHARAIVAALVDWRRAPVPRMSRCRWSDRMRQRVRCTRGAAFPPTCTAIIIAGARHARPPDDRHRHCAAARRDRRRRPARADGARLPRRLV